MYQYLKTEKGLNIRRNDVQDALQIIHQYQGRDRRPKMKPTHRRQAKFPGNNFIQLVDGHSKLLNYGIDIYGAINAFSRRIIWINVGPASNTQVSVARQYLQAIRVLGIRPRRIRSNRGSETAIMADMQYSLEVHHRSRLFNHDQAANPLPLRECYCAGAAQQRKSRGACQGFAMEPEQKKVQKERHGRRETHKKCTHMQVS